MSVHFLEWTCKWRCCSIKTFTCGRPQMWWSKLCWKSTWLHYQSQMSNIGSWQFPHLVPSLAHWHQQAAHASCRRIQLLVLTAAIKYWGQPVFTPHKPWNKTTWKRSKTRLKQAPTSSRFPFRSMSLVACKSTFVMANITYTMYSTILN